jgi:hypothetical protein
VETWAAAHVSKQYAIWMRSALFWDTVQRNIPQGRVSWLLTLHVCSFVRPSVRPCVRNNSVYSGRIFFLRCYIGDFHAEIKVWLKSDKISCTVRLHLCTFCIIACWNFHRKRKCSDISFKENKNTQSYQIVVYCFWK